MGEPTTAPPTTLTIDMIKEINEYIWVMEDTPEFIAGRITAAAKRYREKLLPPFFKELVRFSEDFEYSWHTPGHAGGIAFRKSPAGRAFFKFFGEQLFRSDLSISVGELGSLLDHSGPVGEAERYAAKVFGADETYFVTNGTSTANKIVFFGRVIAGRYRARGPELPQVCRTCPHDDAFRCSLPHPHPQPVRDHRAHPPGPAHSRINPGKDPRLPDRKGLRLPGHRSTRSSPTPPTTGSVTMRRRSRRSWERAWTASTSMKPGTPMPASTRSTATASPCGTGRRIAKGPTVFATQSTHKLLAALSQASMVHVRNGRIPIEHARFNEGFMMHSSTSPLYTIIASCDVSSKMMDGAVGRTLTTESIEEAIRFRRTMAKIQREIGHMKTQADWWFGMWQPDTVTDPATKKKMAFADAPLDLLRDNPSCWVLHPGENWHGFEGLPDGYCMLDPIKVTVLMPGRERRTGRLQTGASRPQLS